MSDNWISAAEALKIVSDLVSGDPDSAARSICARAHAGLIEAKATEIIWPHKTEHDYAIAKEFWWARGEAGLKQRWVAGDFETYIDGHYHVQAFGVSFARAGIEAILAAGSQNAVLKSPQHSTALANAGGRPPAAWWDDLWVEIFRQIFVGKLIPKRQKDIASAMMNWASQRGYDPADSTIKERARKLWNAMKRADEN